MPSLPAGEMVRLWERGRRQHPVDRGLTMLEVIEPSVPRRRLAALQIGERDRRLLELRRRVFGDGLEASSECPQCNERVEIATEVSRFEIADPVPIERGATVVEIGGLEVELRPADSRDLAAAAVCETVVEARRALLDRCVVRVTDGGTKRSLDELSDDAEGEIARVLADLDPGADIELELECPHCGTVWRQAFDIVDFLWGEVSSAAHELLREVHTLAWAYGWSEDQILGLSDARRRFYLDQVER